MRLRAPTPHTHGRPAYAGLSLLLLFVVLVPSVCLVWFSNRAAENEQLAVRQKLQESYRLNLALAQERLQSFWSALANQSRSNTGTATPAMRFAEVVRQDLADSVVCLDEAGTVAYPNAVAVARAEHDLRHEWASVELLERRDPASAAGRYAAMADDPTASTGDAARALQARARCLLRIGKKPEAIALLEQLATDEAYGSAVDGRGRLIAPNAGLLALELLGPESPRFASLLERVRAGALDYGNSALSSSQRRFVLRELQRISPDENAARWLAAEDLAAAWAKPTEADARTPSLRATATAELWQFPAADGREVFLFRTESLQRRLTATVARVDAPNAIGIAFIAPGEPTPAAQLVQPAGPTMPGWQLALTADRDSAAGTHAGTYLWIAGVAVLLGVALAYLAWELLRRQLSLTRLRNDLVANVTHELKTPLASMRLFVDTLLNNPELPPATGREYLELIAKENLRLSRLIDNFLTYSRIERNRYVYDFARRPAAAIAEDAAAVVRERFQHPDCVFAEQVEPDLPEIEADADALVTALVNLLDNAWKYSGPERRITFAVDRRKGRVAFSVTDNGVGLAPREAKRMFQRFVQARSQSSNSGGCGLGLSIVQSIVTAHRGTVSVVSEPGRGSTFTIELPAA